MRRLGKMIARKRGMPGPEAHAVLVGRGNTSKQWTLPNARTTARIRKEKGKRDV